MPTSCLLHAGGTCEFEVLFLYFVSPRATGRGFETQHAINTKRCRQAPKDDMRNILLLSLIIATLTSCRQDKLTFKIYFKPDKIYKTTMTTSSETEVDFTGNRERIEKIKANGTKLPIVVIGASESVTITTTGPMTAENIFPAKMVFEKVTSSQKQNDKLKEHTSMTGLIIEGFYENGTKLRIDTMISDTMDESTKSIIKSTLENVQQQISFPESPMKIGDTFDQKLPLQIPIGGQSPVKIVLVTNYKLTSIKGNKATFDIKQTVTLDISTEQNNVTANGTGTGVSDFDISNSTITRNETDLTMTMSMTENDLVTTAKIKSKSKQLVTVD